MEVLLGFADGNPASNAMEDAESADATENEPIQPLWKWLSCQHAVRKAVVKLPLIQAVHGFPSLRKNALAQERR